MKFYKSIVVVSRGDKKRAHTIRLLDGTDMQYKVVVHDEKTAKAVRLMSKRAEVVVSGTRTLVEKRNWILGNLVPRNHWFIGMDDNVQSFTAVQPEFYGEKELDVADTKVRNWRPVYNAPTTPEDWIEKLRDTINRADFIDTPLVGVATMENPFFRPRKFSYFRFVKTKVFAMKNVENLHFKHEMCHDSYLSALTVALYGNVLVNSFLHYKCKMYEEGGLGNRADRETKGLLEQMNEIVDEFPGLVRVGKGANTALAFRLVTENGVKRWRKEMGYD